MPGYNSEYAVQVTHDEGNSSINYLIPHIFEAGHSYRASVWCKANLKNKCQLFLGDLPEVDNPPYENHQVDEIVGNDEWQQFTICTTLIKDESMYVFLYAPTPNNSVLYDDLRVEQVNDCPPGTPKKRLVDGMTMVYVPAGTFLMGSADDDPVAQSNEKPQHQVTLDAFWIDQTEVTKAQFRKFIQETNYKTTAEKEGKGWVPEAPNGNWKAVSGANWQYPTGPDSLAEDTHPVVQVSREDASAYCAWAESRLPTEAEWEKAARGTDGRTYPWGGEPPNGSLLNFAKNVGGTTPVSSYPKGVSPYGVYDMAGNVWEWVQDWYGEDYYANSPTENPTGPTSGTSRVMRGGSWYDVEGNVRTARRVNIDPGAWVSHVGFRCAR
jgi:formylglycine-generating enzyme required for sulfatase activity